MEQFLMGAIAMGCGVVGLFFLRFWRQTKDRLFVIFACAFWLLGLTRLLLLLIGQMMESHTYIYLLRLLAYLLIAFAIIDKNRKHAHKSEKYAESA